MNWIKMLSEIFEVCVIPLLGVLTGYLVQWFRLKGKEVKEQTNNILLQKYLGMLEDTISNCVIATNQTYVSALKEQGAFGPEEQKIAFEKTYAEVLHILDDEAKIYLSEVISDLQAFISAQIEAQVYLNK